MFPCLINCRVRGSVRDGFYLQNIITGESFQLEKLQAEILWECSGKISVDSLASNFSQSKEDILEFLGVIKDAKLLSFKSERANLVFAPLLLNQKSPYLEEVQLEITSRCNLWCKHCYGRQEFAMMDSEEVSFYQLAEFIQQMGRMNISNCFLSGGESFLHKHLPQIIEKIYEQKICLSGIFTNGTIWRDDVFEVFHKLNIKPTLLVSLDGACDNTHDYIRGGGNFQKVISFIEKVKKFNHRVTINTVVMKPNVHELGEMHDLLKSLNVDRWRLAVPREQGETIANKEVIIPEWQDIFNAYELLLKKGLSDMQGMKIQLSSIFKTEFAEDGEYYLIGDNNGCCDYKRSSLVLKPNGDLVSCPAAACFPLGNIKTSSLEEIWQSVRTQVFKTLPVRLTACRDCDLRQYCGSGCRMIAWQLHADYLAKDNNSCPLYKFFQERIRPILKKYGIKEAMLPQQQESFLLSEFYVRSIIKG